MTVDECANIVIEACLPDNLEGKTPEQHGHDAAKAVMDALQALIYTESVRAAGVCDEGSNHILRHKLDGKIAEALRECRNEILATSPGKVGA